MTDRDALLAAVLAAPADDTPRLIFADFLEETGDSADIARAHFIRAEIEAEKYPVGSPERRPHDLRALSLYDMFVDTWNYDLPSWVTTDGVVRYRRGFVEDVELSVYLFVEDGRAVFAAAPVSTLRLKLPHPPGAPVPYGVFGMRSELAGLTTLQLGAYTLGTDGIGGVVRTGGGWLDQPTLFDDLMTSPTLANLRALLLDSNSFDEYGVHALCDRLPSAPFADSLEELSLADCRLTNAAATTLASARLGKVSRLTLTGNNLGPAVVGLLRERFGDGLIFDPPPAAR